MLRRLLDKGQWSMGDSQASVQLKGDEQLVYLRKVRGRWFMENKKKP
jgi:hypothetical protein